MHSKNQLFSWAFVLFLINAMLISSGCSDDSSPASVSPVSGSPAAHDQSASQSANQLTAQQSETENPPVIARKFDEALSADYAAQRKRQLSQVEYDLQIDLTAPGELFNGEVLVAFELDKSIDAPLTLDFASGKILSLAVNGETIQVNYQKWFVEIAQQYLIDGPNQLTIGYQTEYSKNGSGLHKFVDPEDGNIYLYSDFEPFDANRLFPHFDQPNLKARFGLTVDAPKNWHVVSNVSESKIETLTNSRRWHFEKSKRYSSYVFALHAGPYQQWQDKAGEVPLRLFARQSMAKYVKTEDWFKPTQAAFAFFNHYFDIPYPFGKYDQLIVPDFNSGAMENIGAVTFNEFNVSRGDKSQSLRQSQAGIIAHELAHMWFGNLVTMDWWDGLWLNESFATFMANLALSKSGQYDDVWQRYYFRTKQWAYQTDDSVTTHPIQLPVADTIEGFSNFDGITYGKGGSTLKQLWFYLGEEKFRQGISQYLKKHSYQNTELADFIGALEKAAGIDLTAWSEQWLYQPGLNRLQASFECKAGVIEHFELIQSAPQVNDILRKQKVRVGLFNLEQKQLLKTHHLDVIIDGDKTSLNQLKGLACPDLVYPNLDDFGYAKVLLDPISQKTSMAHINQVTDPFVRLMLWQSMIDSVDDAVYPAPDYLQFVLNNLPSETDQNIVISVSNSLDDLADLFRYGIINGKNTLSYLAQIEGFMWQQLNASNAQSEQQKQWFRLYVANAFSEQHLANLAAMLDGKLNINGINLDQDKRWDLVTRLNQYLWRDFAKRLDLEKKSDPSDSGLLSAVAAEVIRPDQKNKQHWFEFLRANQQKLKLTQLRNIMQALFPVEQFALQKTMVELILAEIPKLNESAELRYLNYYVWALMPRSCSQQSADQLAALIEEYRSFKFPLVKALKKIHERDQKCVEKRALISRK